MNVPILTTREIEATRIPSGEKIKLPPDTEVTVTQALGGSFTVHVPSQGGLYRIEGKDGDAIWETPVVTNDVAEDASLEDKIWAQLKNCYDPEIPVNIVDLGLIYDMRIDRQADGAVVGVQMTLTAPGCGMGPTLAADARQRLLTLDEVKDANVELVWEPQWSPERITEDGRKTLGI